MNPKNKPSIDDKDLLIDNHPDAMVISDLNGKILAINEKLAKVFGKNKEELIGNLGYDNIETEVGKRRRKIIEKVIKTKKPIELIDQERGRWWKAIFHPILDNKGSVVKIAYYIQDITEKKKADSKIIEGEDKYKTLFDGTTNPIMIFDQYGKILMINKVGANNLKLSQEECIGKSIFKLLPNLDKSYHEIYQRVVNTGEEITKEDIIKISPMEKRYFWSILQPISDINGKIYGIQVISYDITDRKEIEKKLKESKEKYHSLFHNSNDAIFIHDLNGNLLDINKQTLKLFKYNKKEILSKNIQDFHPPYALKKSKTAFQEIFKNGFTKFEIDFIKKNDDIFPAEVSSSMYKTGEKTVIQGIVRDITERKKTETLAKETLEKWRSLVENAPDIITLIDSKGIVKYINHLPKDDKLKKFDPVGKNVIDLIPKEFHNLVKNTYNRVLKTGKSGSFEVRDSISGRWLKTNVGAIFENGKPTGLTTITRDITDQKKANYNIQRGKDYLQTIIDNTSEIIITVDSEFKIITWNKTAERIIGYKKRDIKNKKIHEINLFEYNSEIRNFVNNLLNKKPVILKEINIKTAFGSYITLSVSSSVIKNEFDDIKEIIFICKDITFLKEREEKILFGHSYIIDEDTINNSLKIFHDLIINKKGIYIGRNIDENLLIHKKNKEIKIIELSTNIDNEFSIENNLNNLVRLIQKYINKNYRIILFDRIDYLITKFTFKEVIQFFYKINDIIEKNKSIIMIRINSNFLNENQVSILYEEFEKLPSQKISNVLINDDLFEIIKYVNNENSLNINVTYGDIGRIFNISKVTVKKRIENLIKKDLVYSRKIGKTKLIYLTDKGKKLISKKVNI